MDDKTNKLIQTEELMSLCRKVSFRYSQRGAIPQRYTEDVAYTILEKFLSSEEKITRSFQGKSKASTYCIAIINRMCCEIIRKDYQTWQQVSADDENQSTRESTNHYDTEKQAVIQSELTRLKYLLEFFNEEQFKFIVFFKFIYELEINRQELKAYAGEKFKEIEELILQHQNESLATKYMILAKINEIVARKKIQGDAIRMWLNKQTNTLLNRLNADGVSRHDKNTIAILFEMY